MKTLDFYLFVGHRAFVQAVTHRPQRVLELIQPIPDLGFYPRGFRLASRKGTDRAMLRLRSRKHVRTVGQVTCE